MADLSLTARSEDEVALIMAVNEFADKMKRKLLLKAREGARGWKGASPHHLAQLLWDHLEKGDPVDVANFCMMLERLGYGAKLTQEFGPVKLKE